MSHGVRFVEVGETDSLGLRKSTRLDISMAPTCRQNTCEQHQDRGGRSIRNREPPCRYACLLCQPTNERGKLVIRIRHWRLVKLGPFFTNPTGQLSQRQRSDAKPVGCSSGQSNGRGTPSQHRTAHSEDEAVPKGPEQRATNLAMANQSLVPSAGEFNACGRNGQLSSTARRLCTREERVAANGSGWWA